MRLFSTMVATASLLLGLQSPVFAKQVPQAELDLVNQFLSGLSQGDQSYLSKITLAEEDDQGIITKLELSLDYYSLDPASGARKERKGGARASLALDKDIEASVGGDFKYHLEPVLEPAARDALEKVRLVFEKIGLYEFKYDLQLVNSNLAFDASVTPKSPEAESIDELTAKLRSNLSTDDNDANVFVILNAKGELMTRGRVAMTNIFNSLRAGQQPKEEDCNVLGEVYHEIYKNLTDGLRRASEPEIGEDEEQPEGGEES